MFECPNDSCADGTVHPLQYAIFEALLEAGEAHAAEVAYWSQSDDPDPENWWPVAAPLLEHKAERSRRMKSPTAF